jgi:hypothetical protein
MRLFDDFRVRSGDATGRFLQASAYRALLASALLLAGASAVPAQVAPAGHQDVLRLSAGIIGSGDTFQYGPRKMLGVGAFADWDTSSHIGIEAEARWVEFHQRADVHAATFSMGLRYHFVFGRFQPYAKGLVGLGNFNYPYNLGQDLDLIVTAGGGVDYRWTRRISLRIADFEYQDWPEFHYGNMTSLNGSVGLKVRIF